MEIGPDTVLQRKQDILFNKVDGEVVMLSIENGEYYGMDKVGSRIWELLEYPIKLHQIISILLNEFLVSYEICLSETVKYLNQLINKNLIFIK